MKFVHPIRDTNRNTGRNTFFLFSRNLIYPRSSCYVNYSLRPTSRSSFVLISIVADRGGVSVPRILSGTSFPKERVQLMSMFRSIRFTVTRNCRAFSLPKSRCKYIRNNLRNEIGTLSTARRIIFFENAERNITFPRPPCTRKIDTYFSPGHTHTLTSSRRFSANYNRVVRL